MYALAVRDCFFSHAIVYRHTENISHRLSNKIHDVESFMSKVINYEKTDYFCKTCHGKIMKGEVPKIATSWGMKFPEIP